MRDRRNLGFTLIELIVVLVILAILAAAALPTFTGYIDYAREKLCESRRGQILRTFQAVCVDHPDLAAAKDTIELKNAVGNKDPLDYLDDIGAYSGDVTCPRYHVKYEMVLTTNAAGVRTVQLQCPCQGDSIQDYIAQVKSVLEGMHAPSWVDRNDVLKEFYKQKGSFLPVASSFTQGTKFEGQTLYWKPYYLNDAKNEAEKTFVLYASPNNSASDTRDWNAALIYYKGTIYQSLETTWKGNPTTSTIASLSNINSEGKDGKPKTFEEWLLGDGQKFEKVS